MTVVRNTTTTVVGLLLLMGSSVGSECRKKMDKGSIVCAFGRNDKNYQKFEYDKCTHAALQVGFNCGTSRDHCIPNIPGYDEVYPVLKTHFPRTLGMYVSVGRSVGGYLNTRIRRYKTAQAFSNVMSVLGFSFVLFGEKPGEEGFTSLNRSSLVLIKEFASFIHTQDEGWHVGMSLYTSRTDLATEYDLINLSEIIDWFDLTPQRAPVVGQKTLEAYTPLSSPNNTEPGTTEYWLTHVLQWIKPECLKLGIIRFGVKFHTPDGVVEPGINSPTARVSADPTRVFNAAICYQMFLEGTCREYWNEESSTPWAICGDEFFSYDNPKSVKLKVDLAKQYNLTGVIFWNTDDGRQTDCGEKEDILVLRAMQGIRNITEPSAEVNEPASTIEKNSDGLESRPHETMHPEPPQREPPETSLNQASVLQPPVNIADAPKMPVDQAEPMDSTISQTIMPEAMMDHTEGPPEALVEQTEAMKPPTNQTKTPEESVDPTEASVSPLNQTDAPEEEPMNPAHVPVLPLNQTKAPEASMDLPEASVSPLNQTEAPAEAPMNPTQVPVLPLNQTKVPEASMDLPEASVSPLNQTEAPAEAPMIQTKEPEASMDLPEASISPLNQTEAPAEAPMNHTGAPVSPLLNQTKAVESLMSHEEAPSPEAQTEPLKVPNKITGSTNGSNKSVGIIQCWVITVTFASLLFVR